MGNKSGKAFKQAQNKLLRDKVLAQAKIQIEGLANQNHQLVSQLLTIANNPESDNSKKIIEYYKTKFDEIINLNPHLAEAATDVQPVAPTPVESDSGSKPE